MDVAEKSKSFSFLSEIVGDILDLETLSCRIDESAVPGKYEVEFVSVSLGNGHIRSVTIYLLEQPGIDFEQQNKQRRDALAYYDKVFAHIGMSYAFAIDGNPLRIDISFKSSDDDTTFRLEPQFDSIGMSAYRCLEHVINSAFPGNLPMLKTVQRLGTPRRFAVELDSKSGVGRKIRMYYYTDFKLKGEVFRGVTLNEMGIVSREKHYCGVFGDVEKYQEILKTMVNEHILRRVLTPDIYIDHNMSFRYLAFEESDYGVDSKLYFRNEHIAQYAFEKELPQRSSRKQIK